MRLPWVRGRGDRLVKLQFHGTMDIIESVEAGSFPNSVMFTFHPQRWTDNWLLWNKELVWQNVKNIGKRFLVRRETK